MAHNDKPESANEAQDHSQPLDEGGFFSLNDVITAGRHQLTRSEHLLAADTRRNARNLLASAKLLALVVIVSLAMGVSAWAFLASLNIATDYREHHVWVYALLPVVGVATAWVYKNHGLAAKRGNNLVIDSALGTRLIHMRMAVLTFVCSTLTHLTGGSAAPSPATSRASPTSKSMTTTTSCSPASRRPLAPYSVRPLPELSLAWRCALSARSTTLRASTAWSPRLPGTLHQSPWVPSTKRMSSPVFPP